MDVCLVWRQGLTGERAVPLKENKAGKLKNPGMRKRQERKARAGKNGKTGI